jgi:hypothetical protein
MNAADYAGMTNVIWDPHYYGFEVNWSMDQAVVDKGVTDTVSAAQSIQSADGIVPVIIGEYSPWGANDWQVVQAVINAGAAGKAGSGAWVWDADGVVGGPPGDPGASIYFALLSGGQITTFGQMVQLYVNTNVVPLTKCQETQQAQQQINGVSAQLANTPATNVADAYAASSAPPTVDPTVAALMAQGDAAVAEGNAIAAAAGATQ